MVARCAAQGIRVRTLSSYYWEEVPREDEKCLVINYSGLQEETLAETLDRLGNLVTES